MDAKDRRLLAEVIRWARTQGWRRTHANITGWAWTTAPADWRFAPEEGAPVVHVSERVLSVKQPDPWEVPDTWAPIGSVAQAVDLLAALRILPAVFSSAYRSGHTVGLYLGGRLPCAHNAAKAAVA